MSDNLLVGDLERADIIGTDIDIYDESKAIKEEVELLPKESKPGGKFERLHNWLWNKLKTTSPLAFSPLFKDLEV